LTFFFTKTTSFWFLKKKFEPDDMITRSKSGTGSWWEVGLAYKNARYSNWIEKIILKLKKNRGRLSVISVPIQVDRGLLIFKGFGLSEEMLFHVGTITDFVLLFSFFLKFLRDNNYRYFLKK
jgi:hypothetical protein